MIQDNKLKQHPSHVVQKRICNYSGINVIIVLKPIAQINSSTQFPCTG